jgi:hypothetical protein
MKTSLVQVSRPHLQYFSRYGGRKLHFGHVPAVIAVRVQGVPGRKLHFRHVPAVIAVRVQGVPSARLVHVEAHRALTCCRPSPADEADHSGVWLSRVSFGYN